MYMSSTTDETELRLNRRRATDRPRREVAHETPQEREARLRKRRVRDRARRVAP